MSAVVDRLHRCLVEAIVQTRPDGLNRPVTVAEIYQDLAPYRTVRSMLQVELNADYEHALLRLLAGENGYTRLEPEDAQEELRRELRSPDPNLGLFRKFAACDVWVKAPAGFNPRTAASSPTSNGEIAAPAPASAPEPVLAATVAPGACLFCGQATPPNRQVRFCPFCGADQEKQPCHACGETLDRSWRFCIRCGNAAAAVAS
jgi:hypothetical protein